MDTPILIFMFYVIYSALSYKLFMIALCVDNKYLRRFILVVNLASVITWILLIMLSKSNNVKAFDIIRNLWEDF